MRLAVFNVENLFDRPRAMNLETWSEGRRVLERYAALNKLLGQVSYSATDKHRMVRLMIELGLEHSDTGPFVVLRRNRGKLLKRAREGGIEIVADGRADWAGSLELRDEAIDEEAMRNTARVIRDVHADVIGIVEAEHRPGLAAFNRTLLRSVGAEPFSHIMLIDGNDDRGIDVGLMSRDEYPIEHILSHVDDTLPDGTQVFSRDCPEYEVRTPAGHHVLVLLNHLKSKGFGSRAESDAKRRLQPERVAAIYRERVNVQTPYVAVIGDFNDTPDSEPLQPLLGGTDLKDAFEHEGFDDGGYPGTFGLCNQDNKIDYLLLSPALYDTVQAGGVCRDGMWPGARPKRWSTYQELVEPKDAASDHAAVWVDLAV